MVKDKLRSSHASSKAHLQRFHVPGSSSFVVDTICDGVNAAIDGPSLILDILHTLFIARTRRFIFEWPQKSNKSGRVASGNLGLLYKRVAHSLDKAPFFGTHTASIPPLRVYAISLWPSLRQVMLFVHQLTHIWMWKRSILWTWMETTQIWIWTWTQALIHHTRIGH